MFGECWPAVETAKQNLSKVMTTEPEVDIYKCLKNLCVHCLLSEIGRKKKKMINWPVSNFIKCSDHPDDSLLQPPYVLRATGQCAGVWNSNPWPKRPTDRLNVLLCQSAKDFHPHRVYLDTNTREASHLLIANIYFNYMARFPILSLPLFHTQNQVVIHSWYILLVSSLYAML